MILEAKNFSTREELENYVRQELDLTPVKKDVEIQGTREELARLQLSDQTTFYGIKCVILDDPSPPKTQAAVETVNRGEVQDSGLNNNLKKQNHG